MRKRSYSIYATDEKDFLNEAKHRLNDVNDIQNHIGTEASGRKLMPEVNDCQQEAYNNLAYESNKPTKIFDKLRKGSESKLKDCSSISDETHKEDYFSFYHLNNDHLLGYEVSNYNLNNQNQKTEEELLNEMNKLLRLINSKEDSLSTEESDSFICRYFKEILVKESLNEEKLNINTCLGSGSFKSSILLHRINSFNSRLEDKDRSLSLNSLKNINLRSIVNTVLTEKISSNKSQPKLEENFESPTKARRGQHFHSSIIASPMTKLNISPITKSMSEPDLINLENIIIENTVTDSNIKVMLIGNEESRKMVLEKLVKSNDDSSNSPNMNR